MTTLLPNLPAVSIPSWSPLFSAFPHRFADCTRVMILAKANDGVVANLLPAPLKSVGDFVYVSWLSMGDVSGHKGTHNVSINLPARFGEHTGKLCSLEYIDTDMGLAAGREPLAYPKKGASFTWDDSAFPIELEVIRFGDVLMRSTVTPGEGEVGDWTDQFGAPPAGDTMQVRYFGESYDAAPVVASVEQVVISNFVNHSTVPATATLEFFSGWNDPFEGLGQLEVLAARIDRQEFDLELNRTLGYHAL